MLLGFLSTFLRYLWARWSKLWFQATIGKKYWKNPFAAPSGGSSCSSPNILYYVANYGTTLLCPLILLLQLVRFCYYLHALTIIICYKTLFFRRHLLVAALHRIDRLRVAVQVNFRSNSPYRRRSSPASRRNISFPRKGIRNTTAPRPPQRLNCRRE